MRYVGVRDGGRFRTRDNTCHLDARWSAAQVTAARATAAAAARNAAARARQADICGRALAFMMAWALLDPVSLTLTLYVGDGQPGSGAHTAARAYVALISLVCALGKVVRGKREFTWRIRRFSLHHKGVTVES